MKSSSAIPSSNNSINGNGIPEIIFHLPYAGKVGEKLLKRCLKNVKRCLNSNIKFRVLYDTKKISFYCNTKDKVPHDQRNDVIYKIKCPGCNSCYIGKNERCLIKQNECLNISPNVKYFKDCGWLYSLSSLFNKG